jgi:hypothetical protein
MFQIMLGTLTRGHEGTYRRDSSVYWTQQTRRLSLYLTTKKDPAIETL